MEDSQKDMGLVYSSFPSATHSAAVSGALTEAVDHPHSAPVSKGAVLQPPSMAVQGLWVETLILALSASCPKSFLTWPSLKWYTRVMSTS